MFQRPAQLILLLALPSCGSGTAGILSLGGSGSSDDPSNAPAVVADVVVAGGAGRSETSPAVFQFRLTDQESNRTSVEVWVLPPSGPEFEAQLAGAPVLDMLSASPAGDVHVFAWDFATQLLSGLDFSAGYRIEVRTTSGNSTAASVPFDVGNDPPAVSGVTVPAGATAGIAQVDFQLSDSSSDTVSITAEYEDAAAPGTWVPCTPVGATTGLATSPGGTAHAFLWNVPADRPGDHFMARVRFVPDDGLESGAQVVSGLFELDNNAVPTVQDVLLAGPSTTSPLAFTFVVSDAESDPVDVEILYEAQGAPGVPVLLTGNTSVTGLASAPGGVQHTRHWDFENQLPSGASFHADYELVVRMVDGGDLDRTVSFDVGNDPPSVTALTVPPGATAGPAQVDMQLIDSSSDPLSLTVEYEDSATPGVWLPCTPAGAPTGLASSPGGTPYSFVWNVAADRPGDHFMARVRVVPNDGLESGTPVVSGVFELDNNAVPTVQDVQLVGASTTSPLTFTFRLFDAESDAVDVEILYEAQGAPGVSVLLTGNTSVTGLAASPAGVLHTRQWDFENQLPSGAGFDADYALVVRMVDGGDLDRSTSFDVGNDPPAISSLTVPAGVTTGAAQIDMDLSDSSSDPVSLTVEYEDTAAPGVWQPCTPVSAPTGLATSPGGTLYSFLWDVATDRPEDHFTARVRLVANDGTEDSPQVVSGTFDLDNNEAPTVQDVQTVGATTTSPLEFTFLVIDAESDPVDVQILFEDQGAPGVAALLTGNTSITGLASSPAGVLHTRHWDFASQLASAGGFDEGFQLVVEMDDGGDLDRSVSFDVGNDAPVVSMVSVPGTPTSGIVPVDFVLSDSSDDVVSVTVEYQIPDDGPAWLPATLTGSPPDNLATTAGGIPVTSFWNAPVDAPGRDVTAYLRLTPDDGTTSGAPVISALFELDGNGAPVALVGGSAFLASPDERRGLPLPFQVIDPEDDPVRVVFQWRSPSQSFPDLPQSLSAVELILADPAQREAYQIASEYGAAWRGRVVPAGPSTLRLPELGTGASDAAGQDVVGRSLELMREPGPFTDLAAGWAANPLTSPADVLPCADARTAWFADEPAPGTWRVQRVDLQTGAVEQLLAQGAEGGPFRLTADFGGDGLLLSVGSGTDWSVLAVDTQTGGTTLVGQSTVATEGVPRGLVAAGSLAAFLCVDDALLSVSPAATLVLVSGLQTPTDVVQDGYGRDRLFVAEATGPDPVTAMPTGRVVAVDLHSLELAPVRPLGQSLPGAVRLALVPDRTTLLVLTDDNGADSVLELRAVELSGGQGSAAVDLATTLPASTFALAVGPDELRVVLESGGDVLVSGGVQQERTITALDPASRTATVDAPLDPAPADGQRWRVAPSIDAPARVFPSTQQTFVWDSRDLGAADEVVLRATPYDAYRGIAADTTVPRPVRAGLDVSAVAVGGGANMAGAAGVDVADLNGDGRLDLVTANPDADRVTVLFQTASGTFPATPDVTLSGIPITAPMSEPVAVLALDVDDDGDLDIVSANRASDNVSVCLQTTPGNFVTQILSLGLGINEPVALGVGDLNGDGLADFVTANRGSDDITVFFQLLAGLYLPLPSLTLGDATNVDPSSIAIADLDADGDLDVAVTNEGSDTLTLFMQTAPGVIAATPTAVLGGPGVTDGPTGVDAADVNGDGLVDLAVSCGTSSTVAVFLQTGAGFVVAPDFVLSSAAGPTGPLSVLLADLNGDLHADVLTIDADEKATLFAWDPLTASYVNDPVLIDGGGVFDTPLVSAAGDLDGDGRLDVAVANSGAGDVALLYQTSGGTFSPVSADLLIGNATDTPGAADVALGDLDADGDLDVVIASPTRGRVLVYEHFGPAILGADERWTLGSDGTTAGVSAVCAADLNGDLLTDLVTGSPTTGTVTVFFQLPAGGFPAVPDLVLGAGALTGCSRVRAEDLDADGDLDIVALAETDADLALFLQSAPGTFPAVPDQRIGGPASTPGLSDFRTGDLDGDGDVDIVVCSTGDDEVGVFLQNLGTFNAVPDLDLGGGLVVDPSSLALEDLDTDGDLDIACASPTSDDIVLFFQEPAGTFASTLVLSDAAVSTPTTLAAADVDADGDIDVVSSNFGGADVVVFKQSLPGRFVPTQPFGSPSFTPGAATLLAVDLDLDGDADLVAAQPTLHRISVHFGSH